MSLHLVNRLDIGTSGIVVIAKNSKAASLLQSSLADATKQYKALVMKEIKGEKGSWRIPISSKAEGRKNPRGKKSDQKPSVSNWLVEKRHPKSTQLDITIESGRKHQIRKHAAISGHPIVGDTRYGKAISKFDRIALHCYRLIIKEQSTEIQIDCPLDSEFDVFL